MDPFKKEFQRYYMMSDHKPKGEIKTKIKRQVRKQLKRKSDQEVNDPDFEKRPTRKD